ncbi:hypothetical protein PCANC_07723 [Puccinia coronata f. sp. avenae]|uniref:Uncharacterized protein n=1 Tax=Puccinia coronata f. sp. avenae TaxID=200324 RepID=A0A2N5VRC6_9BASI|nr:hypothetical protein PCANC_07723 [Puccinia coronata f. sp. avenae]
MAMKAGDLLTTSHARSSSTGNGASAAVAPPALSISRQTGPDAIFRESRARRENFLEDTSQGRETASHDISVSNSHTICRTKMEMRNSNMNASPISVCEHLEAGLIASDVADIGTSSRKQQSFQGRNGVQAEMAESDISQGRIEAGRWTKHGASDDCNRVRQI